MVRRYLGIDPGKTIGYAMVTFKDGKLLSLLVNQERREDCKAFQSVPLSLVEGCDVLAIEDFVGSGHRSKESNYVLKMIGAFEVVGLMEGKDVLVQAPASRRKYLKLAEALHAKVTGCAICRHGKDALAHALRAIVATEDFHPSEWLCS